MFRHQLLGMLRDGEACHGYALVKEYVRRTGVETNSGYAYRDLQKLVEDGLVEVVAKEKGADRRRRPYRITEKGRRCFDRWFSDIPAPHLGNDGELAARAIFFEEVDGPRVLDVLDRWRHDLWVLRARLERQLELPRAEADPHGAPDAILSRILKRRRRVVALELAFLDDLRAGLDRDEREPEPTTRRPQALGRSATHT